MVYRRNLGALGTSFQPTVQSFSIPASVGGVNALHSLMGMPVQDSIYCFNLMPKEYGLELRKGYKEWAINCAEVPQRGDSTDVKTIISYESQINSDANDRLWAVTNEGIWNVSTEAEAAPVQDVMFTETTDPAGYGVSCEYTNDSERHFLFYADGLNGIHQYEEGVGWSVPSSGVADTDWYYVDNAGVRQAFPVSDVVFVMIHKLRIWVITENSDDAWYLPLYSISGELKKFTFGSKMEYGGTLMGLWNWTIDGGEGVDDYLVAVTRGGDVALYKGGDPSSADWATTGSWFIGQTPNSRRLAISQGGDLYLLSTYGLVNLRNLLKGVDSEVNVSSPSAKINRFLRRDIRAGKDLRDWSLTRNPSEGYLQVLTPEPGSNPFLQYTQNITTGAWTFWSGVPMLCAAPWNGDYYFGGKDGKVYIIRDWLDGTTLDTPNLFEGAALSSGTTVWTYTSGSTYAADNTASVLSEEGRIPQDFTTIRSNVYSIEYTVTGATTHEHSVVVGRGASDAVMNSGNGTFRVEYEASQTLDYVSVIAASGFVGNVTINEVKRLSKLGQPVEYRCLTSFQSLDSHAQFKRAGLIRVLGILSGQSSFNVRPIYDYDVEQELRPAPILPIELASLWDSAVWDVSAWSAGLEGQSFPRGALGVGRVIAVAIRGTAPTGIVIVGYDVLYTRGGYL